MKRRRLASSIFGENEPDPEPAHAAAPAPDSPSSHDGEHRLRVRGTRRLIVLLLAVALVVGTGAVAISVLWPLVSGLRQSNDYTGTGSGVVSVKVHDGDTSRTIGAALEKAGVVKTASAFDDAAGADAASGSIQPGTYSLRAKMSAASALAMLLNPANRSVPRVRIREGLWTSEIISALSAATGRPRQDYEQALKNPGLLGLPSVAKGNVDGYLFPSTYEFASDATAAEQLHTMVAKSLHELGILGVTPDRMQQVLTIASIAEAEARTGPDRGKVARVIENRLARSMNLQLDTTVSFIFQRRGKVATTPAQRASKSPYNTYLVAGLPPGPIDSPGLSAMVAATAAPPGPWLYFVAVNPDTGETRFAVDAAGHAANVRLYGQWCSSHPGKC